MLGVVLVLILAVMGASGFILWSVMSEMMSAGREHLSRQMFACAEQGLAFGRQYFTSIKPATQWANYFKTDVCASMSSLCTDGPFPTGAAGPNVAGYPTASPFTQSMDVTTARGGTRRLTYTFGIYNNPGDPSGKWADGDNQVVVYARCWVDGTPNEFRSVQAIMAVPSTFTTDYAGQAGRGFRNQGNAN